MYFQLHIAAANGYLEVVEFLLNHNVSMEMRDEDGWLAIHAAACWLQVGEKQWRIKTCLVSEIVQEIILEH